MGKIFGIGLGKTGLRSLHRALELLGYNSLHSGGLEALRSVFRAIDEGRHLLDYLDPELDAFVDIAPIRLYFYLADVEYPGSRFILTARGLDDWLDSRSRHAESQSGGRPDLDRWRAEYVEHEAVVRSYFTDRPDDLLVLDVARESAWERLCEFLGCPVPQVPFPWENRSPAHVR